MTTSSKKKKTTKDPISTTIEIKRKQDLDTNRLALLPNFEVGYSPLGVCVTEYCNVTETIDPSQGAGSITIFNGTSDFLTTPDTASLDLNNFTVAAWIRTSKDYTGSGTEGMIVNKGGIGVDTAGQNMNYGIYVLNSGNVARVSFETSAGVDSAATSVSAVNDNVTHLVVGTYNGTSLILYLDDDTPVSTSTTATPETNALPLVVGKNSRADDRYFSGGIDLAQVWNRAWSAAEVSTFYTTGVAPADTANRVYYQAPAPTSVPAQVTGLNATVISNTQINLTWNPSIGASNYKVYRSLASGFTPGSGNLINSPTTNSYNNTGLTAGTTYYYKVSAVNTFGEGAASTEVSKTTTGTPPAPSELIYYKFDNNNTNSGTASTGAGSNFATFTTVKQFGTHSLRIDNAGYYNIQYNGVNIDPNFSTGFSYSFWIYARDTSNLANDRMIMSHRGTGNGWVEVYLKNKKLSCAVRNSGGTWFRKTFPDTSIAGNTWIHVGIVFTAANNLTFYKDGVPDDGDTVTAPTLEDSGISNIFLGNINSGLITSTQADSNIDEFRFFNAVLTSTQINNLKNTNAL